MSIQNNYRMAFSGNIIRIFDPNGTELGRVDIPRREYPVRTMEGELLGVVQVPEVAIHLLLKHYERQHRPKVETGIETATRRIATGL